MKHAAMLAVGVAAVFLSATRPPVRALPACDSDNGGITLPAGFCAVVVEDQLGAPRHLAVASNGDLFVALARRRGGAGGILALRDTSGAGKADVTQTLGSEGGNGIALAMAALILV